jgi:hypothetical protein
LGTTAGGGAAGSPSAIGRAGVRSTNGNEITILGLYDPGTPAEGCWPNVPAGAVSGGDQLPLTAAPRARFPWALGPAGCRHRPDARPAQASRAWPGSRRDQGGGLARAGNWNCRSGKPSRQLLLRTQLPSAGKPAARAKGRLGRTASEVKFSNQQVAQQKQAIREVAKAEISEELTTNLFKPGILKGEAARLLVPSPA